MYEGYEETDEFFNELQSVLLPSGGYVGPYELLKEVAQGGQGVVYKARDTRDQSVVALKRSHIPEGRAFDKMMRGTELAASLEHRYILPILGIEIYSDMAWIVTPWFDGIAIDQWSNQSSKSENEVLSVFKRVCAAVSHAHYRGVIHCDLRPANILVSDDADPCVLDFGVAKPASYPSVGQATNTQLAGDIGYLAPELLNGNKTAPDVRQDVYSLGVLLYVMLSGRHPLEGESPLASFQKVASGNLFDSKIDRQFHRPIGPIIRKATSADLGSRYGSPNEIIEDIDRGLDGLPVRAIAHTRRYLMSRYIKRNWKGTVIVACLGIALVLVSQYIYRSGKTENELRISTGQTITVLRDFIDALGPTRELGPQIEGAKVLQFVSKELESMTLGKDPELTLAIAGLHKSMAESFLSVRRSDEGLEHAKKAHEMYLSVLDSSEEVVNESGAILAHLLIDSHMPKEAEDLVVGFIGDTEPSQVKFSKHLYSMAVCLVRQHRMDEAMPYLDEYLKRYPVDSVEYADGLLIRVMSSNMSSQPLQGLRDAEAMVSIYDSHYGPGDARTLSAQLFRVKSLQMLGRFHEEHSLSEEIVPLVEIAYGKESSRYVQAVAHLAISKVELGSLDTALQISEDLLESAVEMYGSESWVSMQCRFLVANALIASKRSGEAVDMLVPAVEQFRVSGVQQPKILNGLQYWLAKAYNDLGRHTEARVLMGSVVDESRVLVGPENQFTLNCEYELVKSSTELMNTEELHLRLSVLIEKFSRSFGSEHPHTIRLIAYAERASQD